MTLYLLHYSLDPRVQEGGVGYSEKQEGHGRHWLKGAPILQWRLNFKACHKLAQPPFQPFLPLLSSIPSSSQMRILIELTPIWVSLSSEYIYLPTPKPNPPQITPTRWNLKLSDPLSWLCILLQICVTGLLIFFLNFHYSGCNFLSHIRYVAQLMVLSRNFKIPCRGSD